MLTIQLILENCHFYTNNQSRLPFDLSAHLITSLKNKKFFPSSMYGAKNCHLVCNERRN